jgi:hypothetical protein
MVGREGDVYVAREGGNGVGIVAGVLVALLVIGLALFFLFGHGDSGVTIVDTPAAPDAQVEAPETPAGD